MESRAKENRQRATGKSMARGARKGRPKCAGQRETGSGDQREKQSREIRCQKRNDQWQLSKGKLAKGKEQPIWTQEISSMAKQGAKRERQKIISKGKQTYQQHFADTTLCAVTGVTT